MKYPQSLRLDFLSSPIYLLRASRGNGYSRFMHTQMFDMCPPAHSCRCFHSAHCTDNWRMRIREEKNILVCSECFSRAPHVQVNFLKRVPQIKIPTEQEKKKSLWVI